MKTFSVTKSSKSPYLSYTLCVIQQKYKESYFQNLQLNHSLPSPVVCSSTHLKCATSLHSQSGVLDATIAP